TVSTELRLVSLSPEMATAFRDVANFVAEPITNTEGALLSEWQLRGLFTLLQGNPATNVLQTPRITMCNGQQGVVRTRDAQVFESRTLQQAGMGFVVIPAQESLEVGLETKLRPVVSADRKSVRMYLHVTNSVAVTPEETVQLRVERDGQEVQQATFR